MNAHHLIAVLIGGVLVVAGAVVGVRFYAPKDTSAPAWETPKAPAELPPPPPEPPAPTLGAGELAGLHRRLAALEQRVDALQEALDAQKEALAPLRALYERAKESGDLATESLAGDPGTAILPGGASESASAHMGRGYAQQLARTLGLDESRGKALLDEFDRLMERVKAKEKEHAQVTEEGNVTTIEIPRYPDGGDSLRRVWQDWIDTNLTADEREAYRKERAMNRLFGNRLGGMARKIRIDEAGDGIKVSERAESGDGAAYETQMNGPALARDFILESYRHLLK